MRAAGKLRCGLGGVFSNARAKTAAEEASKRKAEEEAASKHKAEQDEQSRRKQEMEATEKEARLRAAREKAEKLAEQQRKAEEAARAAKKAQELEARKIRAEQLSKITGKDAVGMFISVYWSKENKWFAGKVDEFVGNCYHVKYEDGDDGDVVIGKDKFRFMDSIDG